MPDDGDRPRSRTSSGPAPSAPLRATVLALLALLPVALAVGLVLGVAAPGYGTLFLLLTATAAAVATLAGWRHRGLRRTVALLVAGGLVLRAVGDVLWFATAWSGGSVLLSWADVPYLLSYPLLGAAAAVALRHARGGRFRGDAAVDSATVVIVAVIVFWELAGKSIVTDGSLSVLERAVLGTYPVFTATVLGLVLRMAYLRPSRRLLGLPLVAGLLSLLLADVASFVLTGPLMLVAEAGWLLAPLAMAWSLVRAVDADEPVPVGPPPAPPVRARLAVAVLPLLLPSVLQLVNLALGRGTQVVESAVATVVLVGLALLRTLRLLRDQERTARELEDARDAALAGSRAKSAFLAAMSHEIRTPMNGVVGLTSLMLATDLDEKQRTYAEGVRASADSLLGVIDDVLDLSRIESGKIGVEQVTFDVATVVEEVAGIVAGGARERGLELLAYASPDLPPALCGDPGRIRQVLINLAANAVKFTHDGEVVVSAHAEGGADGVTTVRFEVRDTGIGIDPAERERLFEPFAQADSSTTRRYGGTGLGLAISAGLVAAMDGEIGVDSRPGHGSTFWFKLTLGEPAEGQATRPDAATSDALAGLTALVVDDNRTNRLVLSDQLAAWGMQVLLADGATEALSVLAHHHVDLALLDLRMPGVDGLTLASRVAARAPGRRPRGVLLLTSDPTVDADRAREAGVDEVLTKPLLLSGLRGVLVGLLRGEATDAPAAPAAPAPAPDRPATRGRVLVVEDSETNQVVAEGILDALGYDVVLAEDGRQALDRMAGSRFDAVLMDCRMPVMDGYEATTRLRERERETGAARTPVVAMTASVTEEERRRCADVGMDDFVAKPVSPAVVRAVLGRWAGASRPG